MATKLPWGKKTELSTTTQAVEDAPILLADDIKLLQENGWFRIGDDLWRHIATTEELTTIEALKTTGLHIVTEEDFPEILDKEELAQVEEVKKECLEETEPIQQFSFPSEIRDKLKSQFAVITGKAGTGKTTLLSQEDAADPNYIEKGSTTGIAAINCGGRTVHSLLKFFNVESLQKSFQYGKLHNRLRLIRSRKRVLGIDEMSMLPAEILDIIVNAIHDINMDDDKEYDLGLHLIGDFCQLPPVKAEFCFKSNAWQPYFADNIIKLEKVWRQDNEDFVAAINAMRTGRGQKATELLQKCGVRFERRLDDEFPGTTLIPNNRDVDTFNNKKLAKVDSPTIRISPTRRGKQCAEWDRNSKGEWGIPFEQRFKVGAYVMILRNDATNFAYVNGDCGTIESYDKQSNTFEVRLVRTGELVKIGMVKQLNLQDDQPSEQDFTSMFYPYEDNLTGQWVIGSIQWMPLRVAYASTIHKSQGLSLDKVQIDSRPDFYSFPSMAYVAVSRARTPDNLVIVGSVHEFADKVNTRPEVLKWV